jgi:hypothetical protein
MQRVNQQSEDPEARFHAERDAQTARIRGLILNRARNRPPALQNERGAGEKSVNLRPQNPKT